MAADPDATPILRLTLEGPQEVGGTPVPALELYASGRALVRPSDRASTQRAVQLTPEALQALLQDTVVTLEANTITTEEIRHAIAASDKPQIHVSDAVTVTLELRLGERPAHTVSLYAALELARYYSEIDPLARFATITTRLLDAAEALTER